MASPALLYNRQVRSIFAFTLTLMVCLFHTGIEPPSLLGQDDSSVQFDVPALVCATAWEIPQTANPTAEANPKPAAAGRRRTVAGKPVVPAVFARHTSANPRILERPANDKVVQVIIPVTTELARRNRQSVDSFRFDVYWNRYAYPLVDYAPKTQTTSDIAGLVSIESSKENNASLGASLNGRYESLINGALTGELAQRNGMKKRYEEIPQYDVLVASGTSHRGTGAFFRFHPSKQETLEGGRELVVAFRVPPEWRAGIFKIECHAEGNKKVFGWKEPFDVGRAFVVPVYLEADEVARAAAVEFVRAEQALRKACLQSMPKKKTRSLFAVATNDSDVPRDWVHYLIQSGNDDYLEKYRGELTSDVVDAADRFVTARRSLVELGIDH